MTGEPVSGSIWDHLKPRRQAVEAALRTSWPAYTADAPPALREAMGYSLLAPGKRLRPLLSVLACEAAGGTIDQALPAGCAVEMVHTYSLVHDDLPAMDDDDLRRGLPTCHKKFGEALAILAGDALLTLAFEVLAAGYRPPPAAVSCAELAAGAGAVGMVGGQVLDLVPSGRIERAGRMRSSRRSSARWRAIHRARPGHCSGRPCGSGVYAAQAERPRRGGPGHSGRGRCVRRGVRAGVPGHRRPAGRRKARRTRPASGWAKTPPAAS